MVSLQAIGDGTQGNVLHQIDEVAGQGIPRFRFVQADQGRPVNGPAANQSLLMNRETVTASHIAKQKTDIACRAVCATAQAFKGIGNRQGGYSPLFGTGVVAMQVKPQTPWKFTPCALMLNDGNAGVMDTALQDHGHPLGMGCVFSR